MFTGLFLSANIIRTVPRFPPIAESMPDRRCRVGRSAL